MALLLGLGALGLGSYDLHKCLQHEKDHTKLECGKVNILYESIPAYHPSVAAAGHNPDELDAAIKAEIGTVLAAGYNLRSVFLAPENPLSDLIGSLVRPEGNHDNDKIRWDGVGVGNGQGGSSDPDLTKRFEDVIELYRLTAPQAPVLFNYAPNSTLEAIKRKFPLPGACVEPGKNLGYDVYCKTCTKQSSYP